ncbi:hypothetical protein [Rugamonas apoptosis]|uniref:Uncharacterized protein n=1 Tax=Rugamonas apoptosis TaxID=2758570 RepID=A0A7W2FCH8_9BURK|nr:hypothetical protein [Rugamonas apoptosis]MBA5689168.1 hypothetical protein [Rugamonas apoptosis]
MTGNARDAPGSTANIPISAARSNRIAAENMVEFIRFAREDITVFGPEFLWSDVQWPGTGCFSKLGKRIGGSKIRVEQNYMDRDFIEFAKAITRYAAGLNPESRGKGILLLSALRLVERALLEVRGSADPAEIDYVVLDRAAQIAREYFGSMQTAYEAVRGVGNIARIMSAKSLVAADLSDWKNPIGSHTQHGQRIGEDAELRRNTKMPDVLALDAIAEIFSLDLDPLNPAHQKDIYATSVAAMLLCAPSRGQEVHDLPVDLEVEGLDSAGDQQYGYRYFAGKGYGGDIKWVPQLMIPISKKAIVRLRSMTQGARDLAMYIEAQLEQKALNPGITLHFYRHPCCPDVSDTQLLTRKQVAQALGVTRQKDISSIKGARTLDNLWQWVLEQQPKEFPWVSKKKGIKYSNALFCMFRRQLNCARNASPVIL